jgi:hypothetical protein
MKRMFMRLSMQAVLLVYWSNFAGVLYLFAVYH